MDPAKPRNPITVTHADHQVITPDHQTLRQAMVSSSGSDDELIARAEGALTQLSSKFGAWMNEECDRLGAARREVKASGLTEENRAVLLRAAEPLDGWKVNLRGPGLLARGFGITRADYGRDLTGDEIYFLDNPAPPKIAVSARVGVDYAGRWRDELLRFHDADSRYVSRAPRSKSTGPT